MKTFGLIGHRLGYSFSKRFFSEKFEKEGLTEHEYLNFELDSIDEFPGVFEKYPGISGLNCTIPYKQQIMAYLDEIDAEAAEIGAVNTVKILRHGDSKKLVGYNTDVYGFENSLKPMLSEKHKKALILGTGGASKAVRYVFQKLGIEVVFASTKAQRGTSEIAYTDIDESLMKECLVIVNCTPLGTFPNTDACADIPYQFVAADHVLYDLVYNPEETLFMKKGKAQGASVKNGLEMLHLQAIRAWEIWHQ